MSYIALYREWRPKTFNEIIGQEHITRTLKNQISQGRVAHAYLFCGTRGTGKTTTAKVFAKAVNCIHPHDNEPCGKCEICTGIDGGNIMDIVEIDAASNHGVDNIRELRDDVKYLPSKCKYKVYIIDEVHMLSTAAFNALLKTLEEPPAHIIFILATTEYQKVPATILSRCQRYDFKRIKLQDMVERLKSVADEGNISVEDKTLSLIARNSDGAMRDALSIFDQCISLNAGSVGYADVLSILGITTDEYLIRIADAISSEDTAACISLIDELIVNGKDVYQFIKDLTLHFRNLMIAGVGDKASQIINVSEEMLSELKAQAKKFSTESLLRNINILSAAESDAKWMSQPRIILEMAVLRMCKNELGTDVDSLLERISKLEKALAGKVMVSGTVNPVNPVNDRVKESAAPRTGAVKKAPSAQEDNKKEQPDKAIKQATPLSNNLLNEISSKWKEILKSISSGGYKRLYAFIMEAKPVNLAGDTLTIGFESGYGFHKKSVDEPENKKIAEEYISSACGARINLKCIMMDEVAVDEHGEEEDIVQKAISIFGKDLVEVEE